MLLFIKLLFNVDQEGLSSVPPKPDLGRGIHTSLFRHILKIDACKEVRGAVLNKRSSATMQSYQTPQLLHL